MVAVRTAVLGAEENSMEKFQMLLMRHWLPLAEQETELISPTATLGDHLIAAVVFSVVGIIVFSLCLFLMEKITPFSIVKEIAEEHNQALGTIVGAVVLGMSIIIAAAILG